STQRGRMATTIAALAPVGALTIIVLGREPALTGPARVPETQSDGRRAAIELLALALGAPLIVPAVDQVIARIRLGRAARRALAATLALALMIAFGAVVAHEGGPSSVARRATHAFSAPPARDSNDLNRRLFNASGNFRSAYWRVAASMV